MPIVIPIVRLADGPKWPQFRKSLPLTDHDRILSALADTVNPATIHSASGHLRAADYSSSTIGFDSVPIPEISTVTQSPATSHTGGSRREPTPPGVPVMMTSPTPSAVNRER